MVKKLGLIASYRRNRSRRLAHSRMHRRGPGKNIANSIHTFRRKYNSNSAGLVVTAGSTLSGVFQYLLNAVPGYTDWTSLFDHYRIVSVQTDFVWRGTSADAGISSIVCAPIMHTAIDQTNATVAGSLNAILEYDNVKTHYFADGKFRSNSRKLKPRIETAASAGGVAYLIPSFKPTWISTQTGGEQIGHNALLYYFQNNGTGGAPSHIFDVYHTYIIQCRLGK